MDRQIGERCGAMSTKVSLRFNPFSACVRRSRIAECRFLSVAYIPATPNSRIYCLEEGPFAMTSIHQFFNSRAVKLILMLALAAAVLSPGILAQTTISTGSIQGTVTDPSGAVVSGAKITITNKA